MTNLTPDQEELMSKHYNYATKLKSLGYADWEIEDELLNRGVDAYSISVILQRARQVARMRDRQSTVERAIPNLLIGGFIFAIGLAVTIGTYRMGGDSFILAWGAILFGGFQFFKALGNLIFG